MEKKKLWTEQNGRLSRGTSRSDSKGHGAAEDWGLITSRSNNFGFTICWERKDQRIENCYFACCFVWMWSLVWHIKCRTQADGVRERAVSRRDSIICRPLNAEARVQSQACPCGIFVVKSVTGAVSPPSTQVFPLSVNPPMRHIHLPVYFRRHINLAIDGMVRWCTQKSEYGADEHIWAKGGGGGYWEPGKISIWGGGLFCPGEIK